VDWQSYRKRVRSRDDDEVEAATEELAALGPPGDELLVDFFNEGTAFQRMMILGAMTRGHGSKGDRLLRDLAVGHLKASKEDRDQAIIVGAGRLGESMLPELLENLQAPQQVYQFSAAHGVIKNRITPASEELKRWLRRHMKAKSRINITPPLLPQIVAFLLDSEEGISVNEILDILRPEWDKLIDEEKAELSAMWPGRDIRTDRSLPVPSSLVLSQQIERH
jgi:hypothetical protein